MSSKAFSQPVEPILLVRGVSKHFAGARALEDAALELRPGEVHILMGSNGSGKSTLCRAIAGVIAPDRGEIFLKGRRVEFTGPAQARAAGIAVVYQETSLIPTLSVAENILLGSEPTKSGIFIDRKRRRREVEGLIEKFGRAANMRARPGDFVGDLEVDQRQLVEILKVIAQRTEVIIFDEATSSLDKSQVAAFFELVRTLRSENKAIVFISHRMEEVFAIGDRITVLRNGKTVGSSLVAQTTREEIILQMVGGRGLVEGIESEHHVQTEVVLRCQGLRSPKLNGVSVELRKGEILGLGGLHGQGQSSLLLALFGAESNVHGEIEVHGTTLKVRSPPDSIRSRMAYISGDRARAGVFGIRPIFENLIVSRLVRYRKLFVHRGSERKELLPVLQKLKVKFAGFNQPIQLLSGGNQQKVLVSRWLAINPEILLLDDPTKGIDIQAKQDLYALMAGLCEEGASIIFYSSEDAELLANADRILVFNSGQIVQELRGDRMNEFNLYSAALATAGTEGE
jgi:ribose transport system ATP-binding protein